MLTRQIIALSLLLAFFGAPLRASGPMCGMSMPAARKMQCTACCATMKSCALPRQNPTQPTATASVNQAAIAMIAPALPVLVRELPVATAAFPRSASQSLAHAPPRLAVLCTFLI